MKLRQIVCDKTNLTLVKESRIIKYNETFTINDVSRVSEILAATYHGKPVAEIVTEKNSKKVAKKDSKKVLHDTPGVG